MKLLKKENWIWCLTLNILTFGLFTIYIAKKLDLLDKNAWYYCWQNWVIGFVCGIVPGIVMFFIFFIKMGCLVSQKAKVPFDLIYMYPYIWIICFIIPIIGWTLFIILFIYVHFWYIFYIKRGNLEKYLKV